MQIECQHLTVHRGEREVLSDIELVLASDECVALIGPNGSGKTTLLLALLGLLKPTRGCVAVDGRPLHALSARERGSYAAYVPQAMERIPPLTVYDIAAGGRYPHASPLRPLSNSDHLAIQAAIARCGLSNLADRTLPTLSGGERQKTLLAAAIAQDARVLLLDEPNTGLDPAYQVELAQLIRAWHEEGRGVILVSHDLQLPAAVASRVIALRAGRIAADGSPASVLTPECLGGVYDAAFQTALLPDGRTIVLPGWDAARS